MKSIFKIGFLVALGLAAIGKLKQATLWMARQALEAQKHQLRLTDLNNALMARQHTTISTDGITPRSRTNQSRD